VSATAFQVNLQRHFGGGEVYTAFLCRALSQLGVPSVLFVHPRADFWQRLALPGDTGLVLAEKLEAATAALPERAGWLIGHGPLPASVLAQARSRGALATAIAHMPVQGRDPAAFAGHDMVFAVSGWVLEGLRRAGIPAWPRPLYGVADFARSGGRAAAATLSQTSCYAWDRRKGRDRLLAWLEPWFEPLRARPTFARRGGLTLGIVSRLTPIKQFPLLFSILAPVLARHPQVNLEVFGAGGYASVRDLKRALAPLAGRVRFWGQQQEVSAVYRQLDYLIAGLPEKEALGLNVIEAQACGTPVLAVAAPPFTETVLDGRTGFLYRDPREDGGAAFAALLERLLASGQLLRPAQEKAHLERFGFDAFTARLREVAAWADGELAQR
jgi:glycosyltransferase involved in cell wall biosynthesis